MKVKVFCSVDNELLETQINRWLESHENTIEVKDIKLTECDSVLSAMIIYQER